MSGARNKALVQLPFDETAKRKGRPNDEALACDDRWTITGTTAWSGTTRGNVLSLPSCSPPPFAEQFHR